MAGPTGSGGSGFSPEEITVSAGDVSNGYITLTNTPADASKIDEARKALTANSKKMEALEKKRKHQEELLAKAREMQANANALADEISRSNARLADKRKALEDLGEVRFSADEYQSVREAYDKLADKHEEFLRLQERQGQLGSLKSDLRELSESVTRKAAFRLR